MMPNITIINESKNENKNDQTTTTTVKNTATIDVPAIMPQNAMEVTCPKCRRTGYTIVHEECGTTEIAACLICWLCCWPLALFALVCTRFFVALADLVQYCRYCNTVIGVSKRC